MTREEYKQNFTSVNELSKILGTHSPTEIMKAANILEGKYGHPIQRRQLGIKHPWIGIVEGKSNKSIDTMFHNDFIVNILKCLNGIELDVTKKPYSKEAKLEDDRATNPI